MSVNHYFRTMQTNKRILIVGAIILGAALTRLIPHPMNFAPLGAMALFGSAYLSRNGIGLFATMMAWFISDLVLNNFVYAASGFTLFTQGSFFIYGSIVLIYFLGKGLLKEVTMPRMLAGSLGASVIFFVLSNLGVWLSGQGYPLTMGGLVACYTMAIPFFQNTLIGDLFYALVLFLIYERYLKSLMVPDKLRRDR
ncbi:MAG: hypothetical protein HQ500_12025 [Flavobacteriales bacterium]|nr:hypothetical protein [Flavobacteriales bacterium]